MTDPDNGSSAEQSLEFYSQPGRMTDLGPHLAAFVEIVDTTSLARLEHGILLQHALGVHVCSRIVTRTPRVRASASRPRFAGCGHAH